MRVNSRDDDGIKCYENNGLACKISATQKVVSKLPSPPSWNLIKRQTASVAAMRQILDGELKSIKEAGTWKYERVISSPQGSSIQVTGRSDQILNFCANNYLGLSVCIHKTFWARSHQASRISVNRCPLAFMLKCVGPKSRYAKPLSTSVSTQNRQQRYPSEQC